MLVLSVVAFPPRARWRAWADVDEHLFLPPPSTYLFGDKYLFSILPNQQRARSDFRLILYMVNYGRVGKYIMRKSKRYRRKVVALSLFDVNRKPRSRRPRKDTFPPPAIAFPQKKKSTKIERKKKREGRGRLWMQENLPQPPRVGKKSPSRTNTTLERYKRRSKQTGGVGANRAAHLYNRRNKSSRQPKRPRVRPGQCLQIILLSLSLSLSISLFPHPFSGQRFVRNVGRRLSRKKKYTTTFPPLPHYPYWHIQPISKYLIRDSSFILSKIEQKKH
jgi:hypothetical protein